MRADEKIAKEKGMDFTLLKPDDDQSASTILAQDIVPPPATIIPDAVPLATTVPAEQTTIPNRNKKGIVFNCLVLNVRRTPAINGVVETTIPKWTEVEVDETESTDEFYSITTKDGTTGFCMCEFIKL